MSEEKTYKKMTEEERKTFIEMRKEISKEKYNIVRLISKKKQKEYKTQKALIHNGNKIIDAFELRVKQHGDIARPMMWRFYPLQKSDYEGMAILVPVDWNDKTVTCHVTYSLKSPNDSFKLHIGRGICGERIRIPGPWRIEFEVDKELYLKAPAGVQKAAANMIANQILLAENHIPVKLIKQIHRM